jgi:hypothetical protein
MGKFSFIVSLIRKDLTPSLGTEDASVFHQYSSVTSLLKYGMPRMKNSGNYLVEQYNNGNIYCKPLKRFTVHLCGTMAWIDDSIKYVIPLD